MASHKPSFQCFDTITDDPPLKPPFPHGHCSSASLRGSSSLTRLEPLEDRGCYLCADHQPVKTTASEASGGYSNPWHNFQPYPHAQQYSSRRPTRPEEAPGQAEDHHHQHHHHRRSRKIVLVKNSDPSVRRTIVLYRRSVRSLALFMDEVSELMQCLIRKLYTLEGHKIDSVQSLLQCPSVLVCVGREPFHPLLLESFRKHSYDKLPRLNTKSRSSVCSDEKAAKKNVNFGLETKRSVIHPRCDSSNRSARFSSEKLFPNRLNSSPPGHRGDCLHAGENMVDDDIEKRVLVNKDGSLSMEMKVRFRLLHNETLHWSTEVKKSKGTFNESHTVSDDACSVSHGSAESCSEADSLSAGEADETYNAKHYQRHFEEPHCQHCCVRCQEYDIWKNPAPPNQGAVRRIRSSSSSASSRRIVCKKASTDSIRTVSSEEYTEHVVEKATCIQQTFGQQGDTMIEQCTINHCCSRSEVSSVSPKPKSTSTVEDKRENTHASDNDENRPDVISSNLPKDQLSVQITHPVEEDERPVSVVSSSSQILASLKEDQDDDIEPTMSISRTSNYQQEDEDSKDAETNSCSASPCKSLGCLSPRPPSKASSSGRSKNTRKFASPEVGNEEVRSKEFASPSALSGPKTCKCVATKDAPVASEPNDEVDDIQPNADVQDVETEERALSVTSTKSLSELSGTCENGNSGEIIKEERPLSAISIKSNNSGKSVKTNVSVQNGRAPSSMSKKSQRSDKSSKNEVSGCVCEEQNLDVRMSSAMSVKSNSSMRSRVSETGFDELSKLQDNVEERAVSAASSKSNISIHRPSEEEIVKKALSVKSGIEELTNDDETEERAPSSVSLKSNISARSKISVDLSEIEDLEQDRAPSSISLKSNVSQKSKSDISEATSFHEGEESLNSTNTSVKLNTSEAEAAPQVELPGERSPSSVSSKSNISTRSRSSKISQVGQDEVLAKEDDQERASSAISVKSFASARSRKSEMTPIPRSRDEIKERAPSAMSEKSNASLKVNKSKIENEVTENRASSALSVKSEASSLSKKSDIEQLEEKVSSPISAKLNVSGRSKRSKMSEVAGDDDRSSAKSPEERGPSALSTKSNTSAKSKKSKVSDMAADDNMDDLRSASAMSTKSNISGKSEVITEDQVETIDQTEERTLSVLSAQSNLSGVTVSDGVEVAEERALSAMSSKSNASGRSKKSKNLKVPTALPQEAERQDEERAQSALSARSSVSARSNKSILSGVLSDEHTDANDQAEERALSALSAKSKKSNSSVTDVNTDDNENGDRVPSVMSGRSDISTKTSISAKSKVLQVESEELGYEEEGQNLDRPPSAISAISEAAPDENEITNEGEIQERASTALSAKSNISTKSKKSNTSATDVDTDDKEKEDRVSSVMSERSGISNKTSMSAKSKASKVSEVQIEDPGDNESEVKAPSVTKSCISIRSNKTNHSEEECQNLDRPPSAISVTSAATPDQNGGEIQERASSALSGKSNISAQSKKTNASATSVRTNDKEKEDRVSSAMSGRSAVSTKTSMSAKSKTSKFSEVQSEEPSDNESEVKAPSISVRSNKSAHSEEEDQNRDRPLSAISVMSEATPDENEITTEGEIQERASSALSAKSNISVKSKMSKTSATDGNADDKGDRVSSAMSGRSAVSTKTSMSAKSKASKVSEVKPEEGQNLDRAPSAISVISEATPDENEITNEGEIPERAPSAVSAKSNSSVRSRTSKVSEIILDEPDEQKLKKAPSSRSLKSDVSERSGPFDPVNEEKCTEERTKSALSTVSNVSARTDKSEQSELVSNIALRAPSTSKISARSKRSNISGVLPQDTKNTDTSDVRASSAMSAKSGVSEKSKHSERTAKEDEEANKLVERTTSSLSVMSNPSTCSVSKEGVDKKANRSPSKLSVKSSVSTKSKKSKVSEVENHTVTDNIESPVSGHLKLSKSEYFNKCVCGALNKSSSPIALSDTDSDHEEVPVSPLSKKSAKSKGSASERVLTPTSTSMSTGIVEDNEADDVEEIDGCDVSVKSASLKSEVCDKSDQCLSNSPVQITNEAIPAPEERPKSLASAKSNVSGKSKSKCSQCGSTCPTDQDRDDVESNKSSKSKCLITSSDGQPSTNCSVRQSSPNQDLRPSSKASGMSAHTETTGQERTESPDVTHKPQSICSKCSSTQQKSKIPTISSASANSDSGKSKTKEGNAAEMNDRPKSNISNSSCQLNAQNNYAEVTVVSGRSGKSSTKSTQNVEDSAPRCHSATLSFTSGNHLSPTPPKSPKKSKKPVIQLGGSALSQTALAKDQRQEHSEHLNAAVAAEKPQSCTSNTNVSDMKSEKSSKCRKRIGSDSSCHNIDDDTSELSPSFLPNASPTEVVNEWLRKIPSDTALCDLGDEFHDHCDSVEPLCTSHVPLRGEIEHGRLEGSDVTKLEKQNEIDAAHVVNAEGAIDDKSPEVAEGDCSQRGDEPKMFDSSVLVMKVLLSPKLDRCNSLPEVSPVYGRKLSASAQGLLDCLANLQLLDFGPSDEDGKKEKYRELMSMLKSLWLCDPKDREKTSEQKSKHLDEELKARSSSGVDVNSGSTGSGKSSVNDGTQVQTNTEFEGLETLTKVQEVDETVEEQASKTPESKYDSATPDIASQTQWTPEKKKNEDNVPGSDETIRSNDSPRELIETPLSSNKSSGNNPKTEEPQSDRQEDTSSGSAPTLQRGQLSKKISQDPDPVWVLNLLNKLEKQFMTHYVDAMAEFKVRWNLDDNEQLDTMICELQDEVRRRIQSSIDRELKKVQGRAGRPRPPKETMSRESTIQTEQRRRRLKVMRNQSIDPQPAKSDDDYTMTGTDFSDQRSDDEYCPCESCLKKKMASKPVLPVEILNSAPVMMDFDLRRILQLKKSPPNDEKIEDTASEPTASKIEGENLGLEAVKEEDEKEGAEILASSIQEIEERQSEDGDVEDNASSTCVEDSSEKQSNAPSQLMTVVDEIGETDEMSHDTKPAHCNATEQDEEQEENEIDSDLMAVKESASSSKMNDEVDENVANDDISEFDDLVEMAKEEETEEESEEQGKTAEAGTTEKSNDDNAEDDETSKKESADKSETDEEAEGQTEDGQTAETPKEDIITEDETGEGSERVDDIAEECEKPEYESGEDGQTSKDETEEGETANNTAEENETAECEAAGGPSTEDGTAESGQSEEDEATLDDETAEDKTSEDGQTAEDDEIVENEGAEDGQTAEDETVEQVETAEDKTSEDGQTAEDDEIVENETAEDGQTAEDETAEDGEIVENETAEDGQTAKDEMAEDGEIVENETAEDGQTAADETAEDCQTAEDETTEDGQTAEDETAEDGQTTEDETAEGETTEEGETGEDKTSEDGHITEEETAKEGQAAEGEIEEVETGEDKTSEDGQIAEDETAKDGQATEGETAEEDETVEDKTSEDGQTAEDETAEDDQATEGETTEEVETGKDKTPEDGQTAESETAEGETNEDETSDDGQTAEDETADAGQTAEDETAEEGETVEDKASEDGQTAEDETGEDETNNDDTAEEHENTGNETAEVETAEEGETIENKTSEDGQTAEDVTGDEGETVNEDNAEEKEVAEIETVEDIETAEDETPEEVETVDDKTSDDGQTAEDGTAEECETSTKNESAEDGETAEAEEESSKSNDESAEKGETVNDNSAEDCEIAEEQSVEDKHTDEAETAGESDTGDADTTKESETGEDETAEGTSAEERVTDEQTADEDETEENTSDVGSAGGVSAVEKETTEAETEDEGTTKAESEDSESQDVLTNLEVVAEETPPKNKGDVVLDSVNDIDEESGREENNMEIMANKDGLVLNNGESAEAGDEAEDDTEPDMEMDEGEHDGKTLTLQSMLQPTPKDDKPNKAASLNVLIKQNSESEDGAYADGEDSETEEHSQVIDLSSENKLQRKTAYKTFKLLINTLNFIKAADSGKPERGEEDNEHEETPEDGSDDEEESSCMEKDEVEELNGKEKGKLSDITEDTAEEEDQPNGTNDSEDSEFEHALQKQITKSSLESQPGSFEEVHEEQTKNQKGSNHLKTNW